MVRKKKFIDKKRSATFQLFARDSSSFPCGGDDPNAPPLNDRVFVRVDSNPYSAPGFFDDCDDPGDDSIFANAPGDTDDDNDGEPSWIVGCGSQPRSSGPIPDQVRRDILELGLPDDGYNYLVHLRDIKNSGGGSAYYHNSKANLNSVSLDVKAYDASRLRIGSEVENGGGESKEHSIYAIASKTVGVKVQKVVDPDVSRLLDDTDLSRLGSDAEDLEEDFVARANLPEEGEDEGSLDEKGVDIIRLSDATERETIACEVNSMQKHELEFDESGSIGREGGVELGGEKPRVQRLLDEQFDLLTLREYDNDSDSDDADCINTEGNSLAVKLNDVLKDHPFDDLELEDRYKVPGDFLHQDQGSSKSTLEDSYADVIRKCAEYAEMYCSENQDDKEVVVYQESSDESEVWDCETIISTYSNLDNHPGKIQAPEKPKKRLSESRSGALNATSNVIALGGREKLPVDFLPNNGRTTVRKVIKAVNSGALQQKRRPLEESKEEKKERKAAVKEEQREARRAKKELKGLYRCEAQRAQMVAAVSGPSAIHLM